MHKIIQHNIMETYLCGPPIKIGIKLMNHWTILFNGLQTDNVCIVKEEKECICNSPHPDEIHKII